MELETLFDFTGFSTDVPFLFYIPGSSRGSHIACSCHISLASSDHGCSSVFPYFVILTREKHRLGILWNVSQCEFVRCFLHCLARIPQTCYLLSEASQWGDRVLASLPTGDVNLVHLDRVVSAVFLPCEVSIFPLVINIYLGRNTLRLHRYPVCLHTLLLILATLVVLAWNHYYIVIFLFPSLLQLYSLQFFCKKELSLSPVYFLFTCFFTSVWVREYLVCSMGYNPILLGWVLLLKFTSLLIQIMFID